jgi:hypothetical protein
VLAAKLRANSIGGKIEAGSPIRRILDWTHAYDLIIGWKTGIGNWSDTAFRRAMREGVTTVMRTVTTKTLGDRWNIKTGEVETRYGRRLFKDSEVLSVLRTRRCEQQRIPRAACGVIEALD